jgi:predicted RNase H-like HicB family nuclease
MPMEPKAYLKEPYTRILIPEDDGTYSAEILEFPGCFAEGDTPDEAIRDLEAAAEAWIEASLGQGHTIPEPDTNQGYSGNIALRLPRSLHRQAVRMAQRDGTSLNQFLVTAIAARVGAEDFYASLFNRFERRLGSITLNLTLQTATTVIQSGATYSPLQQPISVHLTDLRLATIAPGEITSNA